MKKYRKLIALVAALVLCLVPLFGSVMTVQADGPVTYYLKHIPEKNEWRYQLGSHWSDEVSSEDLKSLQSNIKDGDLLVIDGNSTITLSVNVNLNNLTIVQSTGAVITAKSIENFYAINDSVSAINGNIKNAYVYDGCLCNFNNNVSYLELASTKNVNLAATIAVAGTVEHLQANGKDFTHFEFYHFAANTLLIEKGHLKTAAANYSTTPQAVTTPVQGTSAPGTSAPGSEYDEVPKTGEGMFLPVWLIGIAALCLLGSRKFKNV